MNMIRNMGIAGIAVAVLLAGTAVFAQEKRPKLTDVRKSVVATTTRAEIKNTAREQMEAKREEAKQRISGIRDKKKQELALKLANQFEELNKKWTDHFIQLLERYEAVLVKIQERTDIAATNGKDITAVNSAIQSADTAIENARTAVVAQSAKAYVLDASALANTTATATASGQDKLLKSLRTEFQTLHRALFKDLYALRDGVMKNARSSVREALRALSQIPKVDDNGGNSDDNNQ